jgi:hypothetical protein
MSAIQDWSKDDWFFFLSPRALHRRRLPVTFPARRPGAIPEQHHRLEYLSFHRSFCYLLSGITAL